ncbi:hypothetical protein ACFJGX_23025 [Hydrogenophaga sp. UC242_50]|uniref:hypothetical protein n=1 Tax=Hydrogenophaga sp. UC242_50 TaxID=3350169 RepID=UPI0036D234A0
MAILVQWQAVQSPEGGLLHLDGKTAHGQHSQTKPQPIVGIGVQGGEQGQFECLAKRFRHHVLAAQHVGDVAARRVQGGQILQRTGQQGIVLRRLANAGGRVEHVEMLHEAQGGPLGRPIG